MRYGNEKESERSPPEGGHDTTADGGYLEYKLAILSKY